MVACSESFWPNTLVANKNDKKYPGNRFHEVNIGLQDINLFQFPECSAIFRMRNNAESSSGFEEILFYGYFATIHHQVHEV